MNGEWDTPVSKLASQLEDLRNTLRTIDDAKDELRPELKQVTNELNLLLHNRAAGQDPLYQLPRVLGSILQNPQIGALVFSEDGRRILHNSRAENLLGDLVKSELTGGEENSEMPAYITSMRGDKLEKNALPWFVALKNAQPQESEIIVRSNHNDEKKYLRVTVNPLASGMHNSGQIGGVIAFIADITEHVHVVSELTSICKDTEKKLDEFNLGLKELSLLVQKLTAIKHNDLPESDKKPAREQKPKSDPIALGLKALIADDVAVNQKLLRLQLERMGFATSTANDGKEAFDLAQNQDFDIVLMDCDMPKVDGYEATTMIRAIEGSRGKVPIIAVTAYDRDGDKQKCLESGMNDYITKGSPEKLLRSLLIKWLPQLKADSTEDDGNLEENDLMSKARAVLFASPDGNISGGKRNDSVDFEELKRTYGIKEAEEIVKLFLGVTGTFIECLDLAVSSKDLDAVNHFSYSIKGPLASLKLSYQAELAGRLAQQGAKHKWKEAKRTYGELVKAYTPVKNTLQQLFPDEQWQTTSNTAN